MIYNNEHRHTDFGIHSAGMMAADNDPRWWQPVLFHGQVRNTALRMGPPPRSLAAEANDCFMVRSQCGGNRIQGRGAGFRAHGRLPSVRSLSSPSGQPANRSLAKWAPITRSNSQHHELDRRRQTGFSGQKSP
jgi:hypothetical protein